MKNDKLNRKAQQGFTLIEIIAVLVILGILAAVAVPKYLDMAEEAKNKAAEGAVAAGMSAVSMEYSKALLTESGNATKAWTAVSTSISSGNLKDNCGVGDQDFTVACTHSSTAVTIIATGNDGGTANGTFENPGSNS